MTTVALALDATASRQIDVREIEAVPTPPGCSDTGAAPSAMSNLIVCCPSAEDP